MKSAKSTSIRHIWQPTQWFLSAIPVSIGNLGSNGEVLPKNSIARSSSSDVETGAASRKD